MAPRLEADTPPTLPASPPAVPAARLSHNDVSQLRTLSILHYVLALFVAFFSLFPLIYLFLGIALLTGSIPLDGGASGALGAEAVGGMFVVMSAFFLLAGMTLAGLLVFAGRCLMQRRRHTLCMVVAGLSCLCMPLGTVLGVFTLMVLSRAPVRESFQGTASPLAPTS